MGFRGGGGAIRLKITCGWLLFAPFVIATSLVRIRGFSKLLAATALAPSSVANATTCVIIFSYLAFRNTCFWHGAGLHGQVDVGVGRSDKYVTTAATEVSANQSHCFPIADAVWVRIAAFILHRPSKSAFIAASATAAGANLKPRSRFLESRDSDSFDLDLKNRRNWRQMENPKLALLYSPGGRSLWTFATDETGRKKFRAILSPNRRLVT